MGRPDKCRDQIIFANVYRNKCLFKFAKDRITAIFCRNPKCRSKLKTQVSNPREAFCARGC